VEVPLESISQRRTRWGAKVVVGVAVLAGIVACLDATQIDGDVRADSTICSSQRTRYTIRVRDLEPSDPSKPGEVRENDLTDAPTCDPSSVSASLGIFTVVPETSEGRGRLELIELIVNTAGAPADCDTAPLPSTCVVVRRRVRFVPHRALKLPMYIDDRCRGVSCEQDKTCFRGSCETAEATCPEGQDCSIASERGPTGGGRDPGRPANLPPGAIGTDDAGNILFSDGAVTPPPLPDGALPPPIDLDGSNPLDTSFPPDSAPPSDGGPPPPDGSNPIDATAPDGAPTLDGGPADARVELDGKVIIDVVP